MSKLCPLFCLLVLFCSSSNSDSEPNPQSDPVVWQPQSSQDWPVANPTEVDLDSTKLDAAMQHTASIPGFEGAVVVRNGKLVAETYRGFFSSSSPHHVRSVTKTVMALLIGKAIELEILEGIDQPISDFFELEGEKAEISIGHLLTMQAGFEWDEGSSSDYTTWANSLNPTQYVLNRPLANPPGAAFTYNSGAVHLLSVILSQATGDTTLAFANQYLFGPLEMEPVRWEILNDDHYNGGAGLQLRLRDMAKLGYLLLQHGTWKENRLFAEDWIQAMLAPTRPGGSQFGAFQNINYGYLWWLGEGSGFDMQLAWGWGGQFIATFPQKDLIVITTSSWQVQADRANTQEEANLDFIINRVLAAAN